MRIEMKTKNQDILKNRQGYTQTELVAVLGILMIGLIGVVFGLGAVAFHHLHG